MISVHKLPHITHYYQRETVEIEEINLKNCITFLVGENGKGKSTYLKVLSNVIPHYQTYITSPFRFMAENVTFPKYITAQAYLKEIIRIDPTASQNRCKKWINLLHFGPFLTYEINALSKGNKQKLNLIQLLSSDVPLYLMDEPFSGLDKKTMICLMNELVKSNKQYIITTHIENVCQMKSCEVIRL